MEKPKVPKRKGKIVFTGGGSGGHTFTAMTILDELSSRNPDILSRVVFLVGSLGMEGEKETISLEEKLCKSKGVRSVRIRSGKLPRRVALRTLVVLWGVVGGLIDSWKFFSKNKVVLVFSTGGYVSVPVCLVAWVKKVPIIVHEQTTRVGLSNKLSAKFAQKTLVAFEESLKYFPKENTTVVGNPVRKCIFESLESVKVPPKIASRLKEFDKRSKNYPVIFIAGGGRGSHLINSTVRQALKALLIDYQVIMITGDNKVYKDYALLDHTIRTLSKDLQSRIILTKFAGDEIGAYFAAADLFVGRSGAMFVYEVGVTKTPAIFIPIPWVTHNEQYHNAKVLQDLGLARILPQGELSADILVQRISKMIKSIHTKKLDVDDVKLDKLFVTDASKKIVEELENFIDL
ncbi:MAG: UDP-N-acetylglucosamine--N-acetylmuramyl-(pentapeptide) pyrophosphoryl-undecaprenol N-acetylglucosamine transferase [Patescibacteria group bacterium]|nr:UDP-N-acetylglucosamine--N-acetylmuramyl-(pentapeptide) pyrophosphoryl-undecaprenol N-acetylglucosamine transferase [Patescibacteria group bacterium]